MSREQDQVSAEVKQLRLQPKERNRRPYVKARPYTWLAPDGSGTPGIGLFNGHHLKAHMTADEARTLADRIHDLVDAAGNPEQPLPTTDPESE